LQATQEDAVKNARTVAKTRSQDLAERFSAVPLGSGEDHVYRVIEVVGTSSKSISDAIDRAVARMQMVADDGPPLFEDCIASTCCS
jgi:hypothetical protein